MRPCSGPGGRSEHGVAAVATLEAVLTRGPGDAAVDVSGSAQCTTSTLGARQTQGLGLPPDPLRVTYTQRLVCQFDLSDPRAQGRHTLDRELGFDGSAETARWSGSSTLTNEGGSWSGTWRGAQVVAGGDATDYGTGSFEGAGSYSGLVLHLQMEGTQEQMTLSGWIEPAAWPDRS